ncbi:hypothetical protein D3C80_684880 [compost metagenome]
MQTARKNPTAYEFVSLEAATKLRKFILECLGEAEFSPSLIDMDEETEPYYTISYSSQLLVDKGFYNDRPVKLVRKCHRWDDPELKMDELMVSYENEPENVFMINVNDFKIALHVNEACLAVMNITSTDCSHPSWTEESADNNWRSNCTKCGLKASGSCQ